MTPRRAGAFIIGLTVVGIALAMFGRAAAPATPVRVGSKSFTESYVVAEIMARVIEEVAEASVERRFGLGGTGIAQAERSEEHTSELQSLAYLVCRLLLEKKKTP